MAALDGRIDSIGMNLDQPNPSPEAAAPPARLRRAAAQRMLEGCLAPIRTAFEPYLTDLPVTALGPVAKEGAEADARAAKFVIGNARNFIQVFPQALEAEIRAALTAFVTEKTTDKPTAKSMTLLDFDHVEDTTALERAASRLRNAVEDEYTSVRLRLANLVRETEVRDPDVPFRPMVFMQAVFKTLERIGVQRADLGSTAKSFDSALIGPLAAAYAAIDHFLAQQGVSAELARQAARNAQRTIRGALLGGMTENALSADDPGPTTLSKLSAEQMLTALYQRMQLSAVVPQLPALDGALPAGDGSTAAAGARPPTLNMRPPTLTGSFPAPAQMVTVDANLINAITDAQRLGAIALAALQRGGAAPALSDDAAVRRDLSNKAVRQLDKMTIEIVGLLFDRIQQDPLVPEAIKELLLRLQFPMLKVAVVDPDLFLTADQPARRLLDRIAATSIGWSPEGDENERYFEAARKAVQAVLGAREDMAVAFEQALTGFEKYLNIEHARDDDPVARAKRALAEAEQREVMALNAMTKIRSAFEGVQIESYLREFLLEVWVRVLVAATLRERHEPGVARRYIAVVPELVWSVQPKVHPDDRRRLVGTIPPVLTALREGLTMIDWPKPKMQAFFSRLMQSHAQAVKALELAQGAPLPPSFEASTLRIKLDGVQFCADDVPDAVIEGADVSDDVVKQVLAASHAEVEHLSVPDDARAQSAAAGDEPELNRLIATWQRGDWFELRIPDAMIERVQLRWISPRRTLFLFKPAAGNATRSLTPAALRAYVRSGQLAPVAPAPLFERSVRSVMAHLQNAKPPAEFAHA
jgi:hypothetical protein